MTDKKKPTSHELEESILTLDEHQSDLNRNARFNKMRDIMNSFIGQRRTLDNPICYTSTNIIYFGGQIIPIGSKIKQFEGKNHGYTSYLLPGESCWHICSE